MEIIKCNIIEGYADNIYLVIVGNLGDIKEMTDALNNKSKYLKYHYLQLNIPIITSCDHIQKIYNKPIELAHAVESAQSYVFAGLNIKSNNKKSYFIISIEENANKFIISYPTIELMNNCIPEDLIIKFIKSNTENYKISYTFRKKIKHISFIGSNNDILLYLLDLSNKLAKKLVKN